ncbi:unnamed protein product [Ilex paraguariensis]|uniref:Gnk2-homologous domain-containing protein n=1 Tax=Ilex paraguariensis TaxID=185542 RepID=A0ABC8UR37_9AQUA
MLLLKDPKSYILFVMISINGFGQIFCARAQALSYLCSNDIVNSNYIDDCTSLLDSLSRATSMDFYNETFNHIHGLFLCRGNVNASICRNCVTGGGEEIIRHIAGNGGLKNTIKIAVITVSTTEGVAV